MKNLKKLSREELKGVSGGLADAKLLPGQGGGGNYDCFCGCGKEGGLVNSMEECQCRCRELCDRPVKC